MTRQKTLDDILKVPTARKSWKALHGEVPPKDLDSVAHHLVAIANEDPVSKRNPPTELSRWKPPTPRQARRLARQLKPLAEQIVRMNFYYASKLPVGDPSIKNLPQTVDRYGQLLIAASRGRKKNRPPGSLRERELEILRLLDRSEPNKPLHHFKEAADLIQTAYSFTNDCRDVISEEQLRRLYERSSLHYRLKHASDF